MRNGRKNKRTMSKQVIFAILPVFLLLSGCVKEASLGHEEGSPIVFGASTLSDVEGLTRTEYSGKDGSGWITSTSTGYERIDWVGGKDRIRILCAEATGGQYDSGKSDDYTVGSPTASGSKSTSTINPTNGNALKWGSTSTHVFYAMYPAPGMESNYAFPAAERTVSAANAVLTATTTSGNPTAQLTGYIPDTQNVVFVEGPSQGTSYDEYKANMNFAYMYAGKSASSSSTGPVTLSFKPLVTTFEFTLMQVASDPITANLTKVELSSTQSTLTGKFKANLAVDSNGDGTISSIARDGTCGNKVTITLPNGGRALRSDRPLKINILTLPTDNQTQLTLTLWFGSTKRELALKDNNGWITVPKQGKIYFQNVGVPKTGWTYHNANPANVTFSSNDNKVFGGSQNVTVTSYADRTVGGTTETRPIAWHVEAHEGTGSGTFVKHGQTGWPSWLTLNKYTGTGNASGETVKVTAAYATFTGGTVADIATSGNGAGMISSLPTMYGSSLFRISSVISTVSALLTVSIKLMTLSQPSAVSS